MLPHFKSVTIFGSLKSNQLLISNNFTVSDIMLPISNSVTLINSQSLENSNDKFVNIFIFLVKKIDK